MFVDFFVLFKVRFYFHCKFTLICLCSDLETSEAMNEGQFEEISQGIKRKE